MVLLFGFLGTAGIGVWASLRRRVALIAIVAVYVLALVVVFTALGTIFRTGTYIYATTGQAPSNMDPALLQGAFRKKQSVSPACTPSLRKSSLGARARRCARCRPGSRWPGVVDSEGDPLNAAEDDGVAAEVVVEAKLGGELALD